MNEEASGGGRPVGRCVSDLSVFLHYNSLFARPGSLVVEKLQTNPADEIGALLQIEKEFGSEGHCESVFFFFFFFFLKIFGWR